jgi:uncharacterized protein YjiS (DUF1127 family)
MFAVNQDRADKPIGQVMSYLSGVLLGQLVSMADRIDSWRLLRRSCDEARRDATIRELNLLSDYYLDDVGVSRSVDLRADDLVRRLRMGG